MDIDQEGADSARIKREHINSGALRLLRERRNLSLKTAADLTGVSEEILKKLEKGKGGCNERTLEKILAGYDDPDDPVKREDLLWPPRNFRGALMDEAVRSVPAHIRRVPSQLLHALEEISDQKQAVNEALLTLSIWMDATNDSERALRIGRLLLEDPTPRPEDYRLRLHVRCAIFLDHCGRQPEGLKLLEALLGEPKPENVSEGQAWALAAAWRVALWFRGFVRR
jgi:transcriptional regulator with XRE-family HTH domain